MAIVMAEKAPSNLSSLRSFVSEFNAEEVDDDGDVHREWTMWIRNFEDVCVMEK